jgi:hypothetical protein
MEKKINIMRTLVEVLSKLESRGEDNEFVLADQGVAFKNKKTEKDYQPGDLKIVKTYRFEGESDPGDMSVLYLVEAKDGLRGYILDAYGMYSADSLRFADALKAVPIEQPSADHLTDSENDERGGAPIHGSEDSRPADERFGGQPSLGPSQPQPISHSNEGESPSMETNDDEKDDDDDDHGPGGQSSITERFYS